MRKNTYYFKPVFYERYLKRGFVVFLILVVLTYLLVNDIEDMTLIIGFFTTFFGAFPLFYFARFELESMTFTENKVKLTFFNKVVFRRKPKSFMLNEIEYDIVKNVLIIFEAKSDNKIGLVRFRATRDDDWERILHHLESDLILS